MLSYLLIFFVAWAFAPPEIAIFDFAFGAGGLFE